MTGWRIVAWKNRWTRKWAADLYLITPGTPAHPEVATLFVRVRRAPTEADAVAAARDTAGDADAEGGEQR